MENKKWMTVIKPKSSWRDIDLKELWQYRDLIYLFVKRNFATMYKQTVLGPAWIIINPLFSTLISTFVFGNIAKLSSDGVPYFLFYMCDLSDKHFFHVCGQRPPFRKSVFPASCRSHFDCNNRTDEFCDSTFYVHRIFRMAYNRRRFKPFRRGRAAPEFLDIRASFAYFANGASRAWLRHNNFVADDQIP